ncbi:class I SAM-dependent methyltransferase [Acidovorax sp. YS12]|nr:class I SAM-dependent methyltransferase [Acidovorax sp. YS12]
MSGVDLGGVPETMLWTLHNRASESLRPDALLRDPEAERIYRAIAYDYRRSFGRPDASHAVRSLQFDEVVRGWMLRHRGGTVVELGCGLETQFQRIDDGRVQWLCVDVPESIDVRERFLPPAPRCRHLRCSALDTGWIDAVEPVRGVFVTAQGLLMYFGEDEVRGLLQTIARRLPGSELMFDTIPEWFSRKTTGERGLWRTPHYRVPPMPWGIAPAALPARLRAWLPTLEDVRVVPYRRFRSFPAALMPALGRLPGLRALVPAMAHVRLGGAGNTSQIGL